MAIASLSQALEGSPHNQALRQLKEQLQANLDRDPENWRSPSQSNR
jgi:hypothetical protein